MKRIIAFFKDLEARRLQRLAAEPQYILVVEPSPFRQHETHVQGPFPQSQVMRRAHAVNRRNPYGMVLVRPASTRVERGREVLWEGSEEPVSP